MKERLSQLLEEVYSAIWKGDAYLPTGQENCVRVIHKQDRDPTLPSSYRPISLNVDAKILSQIIAQRLAMVMPSIIHQVQKGFIGGRSALTNIRKVLLTLKRARQCPKQDIAIILLDAEKAFDMVNLNGSLWF